MRELLRCAEKTEGVKVLLCGIPDICDKFSAQVDLRRISRFKQELSGIVRTGGMFSSSPSILPSTCSGPTGHWSRILML